MEELKLERTLEKKGLEKIFYTFGLSNDFLERAPYCFYEPLKKHMDKRDFIKMKKPLHSRRHR